MNTLLLYNSDNKQQPQGKNLAVTARRLQDSCMGSSNRQIPAG